MRIDADENRSGPTHDGGTDPAPAPRLHLSRLGSNRPKWLATVSRAGAIVSAANTATSMPIASGMPRVWKYGRRVKCRQNVAPAIVRPGTEDDVGGAVIHGVEGGFAVLAGLTRLVISADEEDRVVGSRGDGQRGQQVDREGRQADEVVVAEGCDDPAGSRQLDEHHHQDEQHRDERAVDEQTASRRSPRW